MSSSRPWSPDWTQLWRFGACWAGRPVAGLVLPGPQRQQVMVAVMEQFMATYPELPGEMQTHAFIQSTAVQLALTTARAARIAAGQADLWHDADHRSSTPVIDLVKLQQSDANREWQDLLTQMKPRAIGLLRGEGVDELDAEDLFAESIAGLVKPRQNGTAVLHDLLVYEQLPALLLTIVRRRLANSLRHRHAEKRAVSHTISLHDPGTDDPAETIAFSAWAAADADPLSGMSLSRLADECAHALSPLQQHILSVLYVEESASYMEVASAPWFTSAVGLKASASDATRRRALDAQHDSALDHLAKALGISRLKS